MYRMLIVLTLAFAPGAFAQTQSIDAFFDEFTAEWVRSNPDLATALRYFSGAEQTQLERQMTPQTREWDLDRIEQAREGLKKLRSFERSGLSDAQRVSADLMQWQLEGVVNSEPFLDYRFPLEQFGGANVNLIESLTLRHPLNTPADADNYLARLDQLADRMNEAVAEGERLARKGMIPPRFIVQTTLTQLRSFAAMKPDENPLASAFADRLSNVSAISPEARASLKARAAKLVADEVQPAWARAITLMEKVLAKSTEDAGLWRFKGGDAAYAFALRRFTTTTLTAEQIHQIGLEQVARIESEMDAILRKLGRTDGSVRERMKKLKADLAYPEPTSDASRAAIMSDIDRYIADALARSKNLFDLQPQTKVIAQPFPRFREASAAANYNRAPLDGSRPAIFQMPLRPERMTKLGLRTLVYHETVPGHHFQIALEQENRALPRFRQARALGGVSALSEGWALYGEQLVADEGWYEGDPEGLLGMLDAQLFRARRLVVDTGLHAKRWTRQQAIDYGFEASEIERYVVNPGQACAYMIGKLRILELREQARAALGDKFSLREFHNVVLRAGTVPLELLEREIDRYTKAAQFPKSLPQAAMHAIDASDEARLQALLAPEFASIRGRGELVTREQFLADVRSMLGTQRYAGLRREWTEEKLRVAGDQAMFVARSTWKPVDSQNTGRATGSALVTQQWRSTADGWKLTSLQTVRLPLPPEIRPFESGSLELKGMLFTPAGQGRFPAIVYAHGNEPDPSDLCESAAPGLVTRGYVVWCPHRRGAGLSADQGENLLRRLTEIERKQGTEARSRIALDELQGPQLDDMAAAVAYAKTLPIVDARRVFLIGNSFGGVLALLAAEKNIGVAAVADFAGGALNWERSQLFRDRLLQAARNARVPVFVAQAANDFSTGPTAELGKALASANKPHRAVVYPAFGLTRGEGHGLGVDGVDVWADDVLPFLEATVRESMSAAD